MVLSLPGQQGSAIRRRLDCCWTAELALGALQLLDWGPEREAFQREQQAAAAAAGDADDGEEEQQQRWEQHLCGTVYRRLQDRYGQQHQGQQAALPDASDFDACMASLMQQLLAAAMAQGGPGTLQEQPGPRRLALLLSNHSAGQLLLTLLTVDCGEGAKKEGGCCPASADTLVVYHTLLSCMHAAAACSGQQGTGPASAAEPCAPPGCPPQTFGCCCAPPAGCTSTGHRSCWARWRCCWTRRATAAPTAGLLGSLELEPATRWAACQVVSIAPTRLRQRSWIATHKAAPACPCPLPRPRCEALLAMEVVVEGFLRSLPSGAGEAEKDRQHAALFSGRRC
jgi:hypothetical protein